MGDKTIPATQDDNGSIVLRKTFEKRRVVNMMIPLGTLQNTINQHASSEFLGIEDVNSLKGGVDGLDVRIDM